MKKRILLFEPDKEVENQFVQWLKEEDYGAKSVDNPDQILTLFSTEKFDILIMDIDSPETTEALLRLCRTLKKDRRFLNLPTAVLTYKKDINKIASALQAGADSFLLKPFETGEFSERMKTIFKEIEFKERGKKVLDLNYINYLIALTGKTKRESFFMLAPVIFNKLILEKINTILGEPIITQIIKRANELIGEDYEFMRAVRFSEGQILMDDVDKASQEAPVKKLTTAFRDYVYAFLHLIQTLTSDILMERGKGL